MNFVDLPQSEIFVNISLLCGIKIHWQHHAVNREPLNIIVQTKKKTILIGIKTIIIL